MQRLSRWCVYFQLPKIQLMGCFQGWLFFLPNAVSIYFLMFLCALKVLIFAKDSNQNLNPDKCKIISSKLMEKMSKSRWLHLWFCCTGNLSWQKDRICIICFWMSREKNLGVTTLKRHYQKIEKNPTMHDSYMKYFISS